MWTWQLEEADLKCSSVHSEAQTNGEGGPLRSIDRYSEDRWNMASGFYCLVRAQHGNLNIKTSPKPQSRNLGLVAWKEARRGWAKATLLNLVGYCQFVIKKTKDWKNLNICVRLVKGAGSLVGQGVCRYLELLRNYSVSIFRNERL